MNYQEAKEYSLTVPWKITECFVGPDCWCRTISVVEPIPFVENYSDGSFKNDILDELVEYMTFDKEMAEHIVRIHNQKIAANKSISDFIEKIRQNKPLDEDYGISQ